MHSDGTQRKYIIDLNLYYSDNRDIRGIKMIPFNTLNKVHIHKKH